MGSSRRGCDGRCSTSACEARSTSVTVKKNVPLQRDSDDTGPCLDADPDFAVLHPGYGLAHVGILATLFLFTDPTFFSTFHVQNNDAPGSKVIKYLPPSIVTTINSFSFCLVSRP
jgi:hypothetical protein